MRWPWWLRDEDPAPTPERIRWIARSRAAFWAMVAPCDVVLWAILVGDPAMRPEVVSWVLLGNAALLAADATLTWFFLQRPSRYHSWLQGFLFCIEIYTGIAWIQGTGLVSSLFTMALAAGLVAYRLIVGYRAALVVVLACAGGLIGAFALEELGVLRTASLFVEPLTGPYTSASYRRGGVWSICTVYVGMFYAAAFLSRLLRQRDEALREARRNLARLADDVRQGRLSGTELDGAYSLGDVLGRGGMGEVYQGRRLSDGAPVAIKVLHPHLSGDPTTVERFRREAAAVGQLPPEHVAAPLGFGSAHDGTSYLVMELLHGEDLGAMLRRQGRLEPSHAAEVVTAIARAIAAAHAVGILHRDLKPQNVFVVGSAPVRVKLLDFGLVRVLAEGSELTQPLVILGSPGYLAPEQVTGAQVGPETDVFALGAIAYRAITGESAFPSRNPNTALFEAVHHHPIPPTALVPGLSRDVDAVLALALAKQPSERYGDAMRLADDLARAVRGELGAEERERGWLLAAQGKGLEVATMTMTS